MKVALFTYLFLGFFGLSLSADELVRESRFSIPDWDKIYGYELPVGYLNDYRIKNISEKLTNSDKQNLCNLIKSACEYTINKSGQDFPLSTKIPIYRLLKNNVEGLNEMEKEGGEVIFLKDILKVLTNEVQKKGRSTKLVKGSGKLVKGSGDDIDKTNL